MTNRQEAPPGRKAAEAVLRERKPGEGDAELGRRAGLSRQQMNAIVRERRGISLESAVEAARRLGWSLDELFGLKANRRPPSEQEMGYRSVAATVLKVEGYVDEDGNVISAGEARAAIRYRKQKGDDTKGKGGSG